MSDQQRNVPGTAGFALGLVGLVAAFFPAAGLVAWPLVAVGLGLGLLGLVRVHRGQAGDKAVTIAGVALSALGLAVGVAWVLLFGQASTEAENALDDLREQGDKSSVLVYEVTGDALTATISHAASATVEQEVAALPWAKEFTVMGEFGGATLDVTTGADGGTVTCRVTVDGVERRTATASGPHAVARCSD
ncbi:MmpS family protein [Saccharothrix sp. S26]|uniref:MmpS family transport accessory protein n=1 Tax=Saccharothrix sp. S26 TaxID=2907215 RepID=UPI001F220991|nr:MmpS family transport accessory protein [Saccharothrix sp. S26]MCE7000127.1 MmpS family protein [Saccharothrix sp. S26]